MGTLAGTRLSMCMKPQQTAEMNTPHWNKDCSPIMNCCLLNRVWKIWAFEIKLRTEFDKKCITKVVWSHLLAELSSWLNLVFRTQWNLCKMVISLNPVSAHHSNVRYETEQLEGRVSAGDSRITILMSPFGVSFDFAALSQRWGQEIMEGVAALWIRLVSCGTA